LEILYGHKNTQAITDDTAVEFLILIHHTELGYIYD